jgi:tetratricopeptide (TPR) repeat protein
MFFSIALRYAGMASAGLGLSTFHEPGPVTSLADPWLVGGIVLIGLLGWRVVVCLAQRREEAVYWLWAAAGFAPLSGIVPLPYPMADRYLYFILPGLIGGVLLAGQQWLPGWEARLGSPRRVRRLRAGLLAAALALLCGFAFKSYERASVFYSAETLMADAERHYPDGAAASTRKASRAARRGDRETALMHLRSARARGYNRVDHLLKDSAYAAMQDDPEFVEIKHDMARDWIERLGDLPSPSHYKARALAQAYVAVDDLEQAAGVLEAAAQRPGPIADALRADAAALRGELGFRARLRRERASSGSAAD